MISEEWSRAGTCATGKFLQWKNPDFLLRNPDFLIRNPDFPLKNVEFLIKTQVSRPCGHEHYRHGTARVQPAGRRATAEETASFQIEMKDSSGGNEDSSIIVRWKMKTLPFENMTI